MKLSRLLRKSQKPPQSSKAHLEDEIKKRQLEILRAQQGIWHGKGRVIVAFEGFDAAGKGGCIRAFTERLDPRGVRVHPIGPPTAEEQGRHWLYRFWKNIPEPGTIAIFDRTWYGRVLVEKVEGLAPAKRLREAYDEINDFERTLRHDGVVLLKFFLGVSKQEQLRRFEDRLNDPYKQWKLSEEDLRNRKQWDHYVRAVDHAFARTKHWHLVPSDHKEAAHAEVLGIAARELRPWGKWIEKKAASRGVRTLREELREMGKKGHQL